MNDNIPTRCGFIAIVGRPNVGKSTLLNQLIKKKISITSKKPQTTRHRITGIKTIDNTQMIFVDTPGLHQDQHRALNRYMNKTVYRVIRDVDLIVFMVIGEQWQDDDELVMKALEKAKVPVLLAINKIDQYPDRAVLLPTIETLCARFPFKAAIPISAEKGDSIPVLEKEICRYLPESVHFYPNDQLTDRSPRFLASEMLREKLMRFLGEEVPYGATVEIEQFEESEKLIKIHALILVDRPGQKKIIIGENGGQLKEIAMNARLAMESYFEKKVFLKCWVKLKQGWSDDLRALKSLGYD